MEVSAERVKYIFDNMRRDYDDLRDLWYSWLFSRLHFFIAEDATASWNLAPKVLDVGCGTGFQSFLYSAMGAEVIGVDLSPELIAAARLKCTTFDPGEIQLFESHFAYVEGYNERIRALIRKRFHDVEYRPPTFQVGDVLNLDFGDESFTHVNCCGSVLSLVENYERALDEISRILRPGGTFVIEVEGKFSPDTIWTLLDFLTRGRLGYESSWADASAPFRLPLNRSVKVEYPFGDISDPVYMNIRLFTRSELRSQLNRRQLSIHQVRSIHSVTNLIPSTWLDSPAPSRRMQRSFDVLRRVEEFLPAIPGCSIVLSGRKTE